jgi:hypothetical protein
MSRARRRPARSTTAGCWATRTSVGTDAFNQENRIARIAGGMHFQFSAVAGEQIGQRVTDWVAARHFQRQ